MAETPKPKQSRSSREPKPEAEQPEAQAQADDAAAQPQEQQPEQPLLPTTPATPEPTTPKPSEMPQDTAVEPFPKAALITRADTLLGVSPAVAEGILHEADDPITVEDAKTRVEEFLTGHVTANEEA